MWRNYKDQTFFYEYKYVLTEQSAYKLNKSEGILYPILQTPNLDLIYIISCISADHTLSHNKFPTVFCVDYQNLENCGWYHCSYTKWK